LGSTSKLYEILSLVALALLILIPLYFYDQLPERMPVHYNGRGVADRFGSPSGVWTLPGVGAFVYLLLTLLKRLPFSPKPMDKRPLDIQKQEHQLGLDLMLHLKVVILWLFVLMLWYMCAGAISGSNSLPAMLLPFFLIAVFATIGWSLVKVFKLR